MSRSPEVCPVCRGGRTVPLIAIDGKSYRACTSCEARYLVPAHYPGREQEAAHYRLHENDPADPRYRAFLSKLFTPLIGYLKPGSSGLDYGCGPGPALAAMLTEAGHRMALYDPVFEPDPAPLAETYDFVVCTETAEHFHDPYAEFARLDRLVRPGGILGLMTCFQTDDARFAAWHYRKDPTHVVFYREATMRFIARRFGWRCEIPVKDAALMWKPG